MVRSTSSSKAKLTVVAGDVPDIDTATGAQGPVVVPDGATPEGAALLVAEANLPDLDGADLAPVEPSLPGDLYAIVHVATIAASSVNPRADLDLDEEFVASIRDHGIMQPLVVAPTAGEDDASPYNLISGHRRLAAAIALGWDQVPVVLRATASSSDEEVLRLVENIQRADLSPVDEGRAYLRLKDVHGMSQTEIAAAVSRGQGHVSKRIALLKLPAAGLEMVLAGALNLEDALDIARCPPRSVTGCSTPWTAGCPPSSPSATPGRRSPSSPSAPRPPRR